MKVLFVGDVHAVPNELGDCEKLLQLVRSAAKDHSVDHIVLLGDIYHTHALVRVEVLDFWNQWMSILKHSAKEGVIVLKGNHDMPGDTASRASGVDLHADGRVWVVERMRRHNNVLFLSFHSSEEEFIRICNENPTNSVVCHQTFLGAQYENGFYAKDGIEPSRIPQSQVISGHIHMPSEFDKVWYPGSPRWRTVSDANTERNLWVADFDSAGNLTKRVGIPVDVCQKIFAFDVTPEAPFDMALYNESDRYVFDVKGPSDFIEQQKAVLAGKGRIRTFPTATKKIEIKESEGIGKAFATFMDSYVPKFGTAPETLQALVKDRVAI